MAQEPLFQGYDYIFPGLKDISLEQVQNIYDEVINNVDYLTPEWSGKMRSIVDIRKPLFINNEVNPEVFSFDYLDKIANFARQHGMKMRLHNIIWHQDFRPPFASLAKDKLLMFLDTYMQILNRRYGDVIYAVDILNEIASDEKDEVLRSSKWKDILGEDYYIDILRLAKKNFGSIPLYYNEYGEDRQEKRANVLAIIAKIKEIEQQEQITLLDGIGIQAHYNTDTPDQAIKDAYLDYAKTDKILAISEFDVTNKGNSDTFDYQTNRVYRTVLDMATSLNINLFNIWGVSQNISWKSGNVNNFLDATGKVSVYTKKICQAYSAKQKKENLLKNEL